MGHAWRNKLQMFQLKWLFCLFLILCIHYDTMRRFRMAYLVKSYISCLYRPIVSTLTPFSTMRNSLNLPFLLSSAIKSVDIKCIPVFKLYHIVHLDIFLSKELISLLHTRRFNDNVNEERHFQRRSGANVYCGISASHWFNTYPRFHTQVS